MRHPPLSASTVVFELTALVGYYSTLALQLRVFRVGVRLRDCADTRRYGFTL